MGDVDKHEAEDFSRKSRQCGGRKRYIRTIYADALGKAGRPPFLLSHSFLPSFSAPFSTRLDLISPSTAIVFVLSPVLDQATWILVLRHLCLPPPRGPAAVLHKKQDPADFIRAHLPCQYRLVA